MKSEYEKMLSGEPYVALDPEIFELGNQAADHMRRHNALPANDIDTLIQSAARFLHPDSQSAFIKPPFFFDFGRHIKCGEMVFFNYNCTVLDSAPVTIGSFTAFAPNCQLITATHPVEFERRLALNPDGPMPRIPTNYARPITIGEGVWLGAGAIVMPGVTIGDRAVIGAGSVVTRDIPADVIAVGNPCRVMRPIDQNNS